MGIPMDSVTEEPAICWAYGRTLGNIAVFSPMIVGNFPSKRGSDAVLPCDFVTAGKFRNGAARWWCRTHQTHWGTKADEEAYSCKAGAFILENGRDGDFGQGWPSLSLSGGGQVRQDCRLTAVCGPHRGRGESLLLQGPGNKSASAAP